MPIKVPEPLPMPFQDTQVLPHLNHHSFTFLRAQIITPQVDYQEMRHRTFKSKAESPDQCIPLLPSHAIGSQPLKPNLLHPIYRFQITCHGRDPRPLKWDMKTKTQRAIKSLYPFPDPCPVAPPAHSFWNFLGFPLKQEVAMYVPLPSEQACLNKQDLCLQDNTIPNTTGKVEQCARPESGYLNQTPTYDSRVTSQQY